MRRILHNPGQALRHRALPLALVSAAALSLGACRYEPPGILGSLNCKKIKSDMLHVGPDQTCRFKYDGGDVAKYVVVVTRPPAHGQATGDGKYLKYIARPGFVGEDQLKIRVERRGIGHVQWQDLSVRVKVGPMA